MTVPSLSFVHVRESLNSVFGAGGVHFTVRRSDAAFPCAIWELEAENVQPMISDPHHLLSIDVTIDVQAKTATEALAKAEEVREALNKGRFPVRRTSYDIDEVKTDQKTEPRGTPKTLFIASASYNVSE